jgi:hypothetical protein
VVGWQLSVQPASQFVLGQTRQAQIGSSAIINSNRGPAVMSNPAMSGPRNMPTLTLDLKQGYSYYFAAKIPKNRNPSQWKPVVIKTIKGH